MIVQQLFDWCKAAFKAVSPQVRGGKGVKTLWETEKQRFATWGDGFDVDTGELDRRFSQNEGVEHLHKSVVILLSSIAGYLQKQLGKDSKLHESLVELSRHVVFVEFNAYEYIWDDDDDCYADLTELVEDVKTANDSLCSLIPFIEDIQATEPLATLPLVVEPSDFYRHVIFDKFPKLDSSLAESLAQLNWLRHQRLRATQREAEEGTMVATTHNTFITRRPEISERNTVVTFEDSAYYSLKPVEHEGSVVSDSSYATTNPDHKDLHARVPNPPVDIEFVDEFQCNLCFAVVKNVHNKSQWKKHVFEDLQPYSCLHDNCASSRATFRSRREWMKHLSEHRSFSVRWLCIGSCGKSFNEKSDFTRHVLDVHLSGTSQLSDGLVEDMTRLCEERQMTDFDGFRQQCVFCTEKIGTEKAWRRHVGRHLEDIALRTLPQENSYDGEASDENSSQSTDHNPLVGWRRELQSQERAQMIAPISSSLAFGGRGKEKLVPPPLPRPPLPSRFTKQFSDEWSSLNTQQSRYPEITGDFRYWDVSKGPEQNDYMDGCRNTGQMDEQELGRRMYLSYEENPNMELGEIEAVYGVERSAVSKILRQKDQYLFPDGGSRSPVKHLKGKSPTATPAAPRSDQFAPPTQNLSASFPPHNNQQVPNPDSGPNSAQLPPLTPEQIAQLDAKEVSWPFRRQLPSQISPEFKTWGQMKQYATSTNNLTLLEQLHKAQTYWAYLIRKQHLEWNNWAQQPADTRPVPPSGLRSPPVGQPQVIPPVSVPHAASKATKLAPNAGVPQKLDLTDAQLTQVLPKALQDTPVTNPASIPEDVRKIMSPEQMNILIQKYNEHMQKQRMQATPSTVSRPPTTAAATSPPVKPDQFARPATMSPEDTQAADHPNIHQQALERTVTQKTEQEVTNTGCITCQRWERKCDETKPKCRNCLKEFFACEGYNNQQSQKQTVPPKHRPSRIGTGCITCRKRRLKCDEQKPECHNCRKSGKFCEGRPALTKPKTESEINQALAHPPMIHPPLVPESMPRTMSPEETDTQLQKQNAHMPDQNQITKSTREWGYHSKVLLAPEDKEIYEFEASVAQDKYNSELQEYKKWENDKKYVKRLAGSRLRGLVE